MEVTRTRVGPDYRDGYTVTLSISKNNHELREVRAPLITWASSLGILPDSSLLEPLIELCDSDVLDWRPVRVSVISYVNQTTVHVVGV
jgi:hypothetical protein